MKEELKKFTLSTLIILALVLAIPVLGDNESKPIPITDTETRKALVDSYKAILAADKDFQIALLKARIKYKVDETWGINLDSLTFTPPEKPKEVKKEIKP